MSDAPAVAENQPAEPSVASVPGKAADGRMQPAVRIFALSASALGMIFVFNSFMNFRYDWPGVEGLWANWELFGFEKLAKPLSGGESVLGLVQLALNVAAVLLIVLHVVRTRNRTLLQDADRMSEVAAFIARAAFWGVLFVGLADTIISFLRVEGFLEAVVGDTLARNLGISAFRGAWVHVPLMILGVVVACFYRSVGFIWLALLVVVAELQIVILRFIFSYEQAFMADLVRFWYAAMFLFASAYTLLHEGHVRVDVLYSGFNARKKAWTNALGAIFLGAPVCWIVLTMGLSNKLAIISGPVMSYEVSQAGFGLYVKYLLAGYLLIFAITMLLEFMAALMRSAGVLLGEADSLDRAERATQEEPAHA